MGLSIAIAALIVAVAGLWPLLESLEPASGLVGLAVLLTTGLLLWLKQRVRALPSLATIGRNDYMRENSNLQQGFEDYYFFPRSPGASLGGQVLSRLAPSCFGWSDPSSAELTEMALGWIQKHHDRRFLLWLHYFDPHIPPMSPTRA